VFPITHYTGTRFLTLLAVILSFYSPSCLWISLGKESFAFWFSLLPSLLVIPGAGFSFPFFLPF